MIPVPNKLMPWLQAIAASVLILLFCFMTVGPMFGLPAADADMKEAEKNIMFILTGFLFGSAVSSGKKDDQNAALTSALITPPTNGLAGATPAGTPSDPVATKEVV